MTNSYTFEEPSENIDINVEDAKISIEPTEESFVKVVCEEPEECAHEVKVEDNTLIIRYKEEHSIIRFNIAHRPSITVYLPEKVYGDIKIESDCGPIALSKGLTFTNLNANCDAASFNCSADVIDNMEVECDCGTMRLSDLACGSMNLENDAGKIELKNVNCERDIHIEDDCGSIVLSKVNCESLYCENDAGKIDLSNVIAQRHINLSDDCGAISIKDCDCADARIKNEIGSIKGHFLSDKKFIAESEVGSINVPEGKEGGLCKVTTEIGSIYFD